MTPWHRRLLQGLFGAGALLLFTLALLAAIQVNGLGLADDAFIGLRLARNLASGEGLVFNPGGPRVEATSALLLVLLQAGACRIGLSGIHFTLALSLSSAALTLLLLAWIVRRHHGVAWLWAPLALASSGLLLRNATTGLETMLTGLLLLAAVGLYLHAGRGPGPDRRSLALSSLLLALVTLLRPEGPIYLLTLGGLRLLDLWRRRRARRPLDLVTELWWAGSFFAVFIPCTVARALYFGQLLPNTYYAKALTFSGLAAKLQTGAWYFQTISLIEPLFPAALLAGLLALALRPNPRLRLLWILLLTHAAFIVLSGGDWPHMFGFARFLCPVSPLVLWLLVEVGSTLWQARQPLLLGVGALGLIVVSQLDLPRLVQLNLPGHFELQVFPRQGPTWRVLRQAYLVDLPRRGLRRWLDDATYALQLRRYPNSFDARAGLWLRDRYGRQTRVASVQAGQFAYWSEQPFFDLFGLVTPEVAHLHRGAPAALRLALERFEPRIIAWLKIHQGVHGQALIDEGTLFRSYGFRYLLQDPDGQAFVILERGQISPVSPREILLAPTLELRRLVSPGEFVLLRGDRARSRR